MFVKYLTTEVRVYKITKEPFQVNLANFELVLVLMVR